MVFGGFVRDRTRAEAPNALEVFHRKESERDVGAHDEDRHDDRAPDVEVERPRINLLADERGADPEHPARDGESRDHAHEEQIGSLLTAVVATLRGNFHRAERDLEEAAGIAAEVAEPVDRVAVPFQAGAKNEGKTVRSHHDEAEQIEREDRAEDQVGDHVRFRGFGGGFTEVHVRTRKEKGKPRDRVERVEDLVGGMEAENAIVSHG